MFGFILGLEWTVTNHSKLGLDRDFIAQDKTKAGVITDIINTKQGTFGLDIYEIYFVHTHSIKTGKWQSYTKSKLNVGDLVRIETDVKNTSRKRIKGTVSELKKDINNVLAFILFFFLCILVYNIKVGLAKYKLVTKGTYTNGYVQSIEELKVPHDSPDQYAVVISFKDHDNQENKIQIITTRQFKFKAAENIQLFYDDTVNRETVIFTELPAKTRAYISRHWMN